jgi:flagella basal body P-ring formation protein FlgA
MILGFIACLLAASAAAASEFELLAEVQVTSRGILLEQLFSTNSAVAPAILLGPAPAIGRPILLTREQVFQALLKAGVDASLSSIGGADKVRIVRKTRPLTESDLRELAASELTRQYLRDRGELEIRFTRGWAAITVPDEPLKLQILDLPSGGIAPSFILRAEISAGTESLGAWHIPIQARIWKDLYVTRSPAFRGQSFHEADLVKERRDVLTLRDALTSVLNEDALEFAESVPAGQPLLTRALRIRPAVRRGKTIDALVRDGGMSISVRVEVLEDGVPGQTIRVRNLQSRKEFRGKVQDEQTVVVLL